MSEENIPSENSKKEILNSKQEEVTKNISQLETIEQIQNTKLETENMEVHHHPKVEKKNFKEYFLEFLMIFLAVTLGFFAENLREGISERNQEKEYMQSLLEDVVQDIKNIQSVIDLDRIQIKGKDSLIQLINNGVHTQEDQNTFYKLHWKYVGYVNTVAFSKGTFSQLLNAGGLRLVKSKKISDAIAEYASKVNELETVEQPDNLRLVHEAIIESKKIIDTKYMRAVPADSLIAIPLTKPLLRTANNDVLKDFSFVLELDKENTIIRISLLQKQLKSAEDLLHLLKTEYHLGNQ